MTEPVEEFTELYDANVPRLDLVGKGANGMPFLIAKSDAGTGLIPSDVVRALIAKATPAEPVRDDITMTGSPAAIAAMIHAAPTRQESTMTQPVAKADDITDAPVEVADIVSDAPAGTTADSSPGSPDWEQLDAENAGNIIGVLARVKGALGYLADREATEAVTGGDVDDECNAWDMEDACAAIDSIIGRLAAYAAGEQIEAQIDEEMEAVGKAAAGLDPSALDTFERLGPIRKAGKVLSSANETAIRGAVESLQKVLSSLPNQTPETVEKAGKENTVTTTDTTTPADAAPVTKADTKADAKVEAEPTTFTLSEAAEHVAANDGHRIAKAKGDPQMAVYDADSNLVGVIDPSNLSPIAKPTPPDNGDASGTEQPPADANDGPAADQTAAAPAAVAAPTTTPMQKSDLEELVKSALASTLDAALAPLQERLAKVEAQPATGGPMLNGATPDQAAGQPVTRDGATGNDPIGDLRKAYESETNPVRRQELQMELAAVMVRAAPRV